jgi:1-acyl-sn-glycerol-3-phosphate acyltransferase
MRWTITPLIKSLFSGFPYPQPEARRILARWARGWRYEVEGLEHLPAEGAAILVLNHTGWEEILLTILALPRSFRFVGLHELLYLDDPLSWERLFETVHFSDVTPAQRRLAVELGRLCGEVVRLELTSFGFIPIQLRNQVRSHHVGTNGFRRMLQSLSRGELLVLFPEAGLSRQGILRPFRQGTAVLLRWAERAGLRVPVIPAAQHSAGSITWTLRPRSGARLVLGEPEFFATEGRSPEAFDAEVTLRLEERVARLLPRARRTPVPSSAGTRGAVHA